MNTQTLVPDKVRERGIKALRRELGAAGMAQFIQQFRGGSGDYSKERHKVLDKFSVDDIFHAIRKQRRKP
jgi:hypothetical protein